MPGRPHGSQVQSHRSVSHLATSDLRSQLDALDAQFSPVQHACRRLLEARTPLPPLLHSPQMEARIRIVETGLATRHGSAFREPSWHGPTSLQRVVWQDPEALALLADPAATLAIVHRYQQGQGRALGPITTLGNAVVGGLACNRPSYLLTACPNWALRPPAPDVSFDRLSDMRVPDHEQPEPFIVTDDLLDAVASAIGAVQYTLVTEGMLIAHPSTNEVWDAIDRASAKRLHDAVVELLSPEKAFLLMDRPDNPSTSVPRMTGQCLEVMQYFDQLLETHAGSLERVLGFGLVSHALDAKHLAATLVHGVRMGNGQCAGVTNGTAIQAFCRLMRGAADEDLGHTANALMRARLQQVMRLLSDHSERLGLSQASLRQALT